MNADDGWQVVIPDFDDLPHSTDTINPKEKELAWMDCPCKPKINVLDKIIIHNSFVDENAINESMNKLT